MEKTLSKKKKILRFVVTAAVVIFVLYLLQRLLMPKYMTGVVEGAMIAEYYNEEKDHDVIFVGDCELYENISPEVLWEEYGINSYIRGSFGFQIMCALLEPSIWMRRWRLPMRPSQKN